MKLLSQVLIYLFGGLIISNIRAQHFDRRGSGKKLREKKSKHFFEKKEEDLKQSSRRLLCGASPNKSIDVKDSGTKSGGIDFIGDEDYYSVHVPAGGVAEFSTCSVAHFDTTLTLYSKDCSKLIRYDDDGCGEVPGPSKIEYENDDCGVDFILTVGGFGASFGSYVLSYRLLLLNSTVCKPPPKLHSVITSDNLSKSPIQKTIKKKGVSKSIRGNDEVSVSANEMKKGTKTGRRRM